MWRIQNPHSLGFGTCLACVLGHGIPSPAPKPPGSHITSSFLPAPAPPSKVSVGIHPGRPLIWGSHCHPHTNPVPMGHALFNIPLTTRRHIKILLEEESLATTFSHHTGKRRHGERTQPELPGSQSETHSQLS